MACTNQNQRQTSSVFADDAETDTLAENYDLYEIQESGELIVATLSGPDTYFEFRGRGFGLHLLPHRTEVVHGVGRDFC